MPLSKPLEELLEQVKDEADRKALRANFEKYNFFVDRFEGNLRQSDYDKFMNQTKSEREKEKELVEGYKADRDKWKAWADTNVPKHTELLKSYGELETKYKQLEEEKAALAIEAAAKAGEGGAQVDAKEVLKQLNDEITKRGYMSRSEAEKFAAEVAAKEVAQAATKERESFLKETLPGILAYNATLNEIQWRHRDEFKESLDMKAFDKFVGEKKISDLSDAYTQFTADRRQKLHDDQIVKDTTEKLNKEWATKVNMPGSGAPPVPDFGPLQLRQLNKLPDVGENTKEAAMNAAAELRAEGKW